MFLYPYPACLLSVKILLVVLLHLPATISAHSFSYPYITPCQIVSLLVIFCVSRTLYSRSHLTPIPRHFIMDDY